MSFAVDFKPRLRHCTIVADPANAYVTLVVGTKHFRLEQEIGGLDDFFRMKSYFDGHHTLTQISEATAIPPEELIDVVHAFDDAGLLQQPAEIPEVDVGDFLQRIEDSSIMWRRQIGLNRLFGELEAGLLPKEVFLGLLLETYHYVRHLSPALARAANAWPDSSFKSVVLEYANEEMDHYLDYEAVLESVPRLKERVTTSHPTVTTLSLVRNFEAIGRRSPLSLVCCLQMIEARPFEADDAEEHLRRIAAKYQSGDLVEPFLRHMRADLGLSHSNLLQKALADTTTLAVRDVHEAVNDMHDIKHCFDEFHDGIKKYYADVSNYIPRPTVNYFAL